MSVELHGIGGSIDELSSSEVDLISDDDLESTLVELSRFQERLQAEWCRRFREFDRRRLWRRGAFTSAASWAQDRCHMAWGAARERLEVARALEEGMPRTKKAFSSGELSYARVRHLAKGAVAHPEAFLTNEEELLSSVRESSPVEVRKAVEAWSHGLDEEAALRQANHRYRRRRLDLSVTPAGMTRLEGELDPEGAQVGAAIRSLAEEAARTATPEDPTTSAQRRADALVEICREHLGGDGAGAGRSPVQLSVIVDLARLEGGEGRAEFEDGEPMAAETARRLACDASVSRVIVRGVSQPLDVGRATRAPPAAVRRAVALRDRGCRFAGCDRPNSWCDSHHLDHWVRDLGPTATDNLVMLCRAHHRMVHEGGVEVRLRPARGP
jgi:hypothetical protein